MTTWLRKCVSLALMVASLALGATSLAGQRRAQRADYDRRASMNLRAAPNQVQIEALAALREDLDGSLLESVDSSSGVTHSLFNPVGKLTLPNAGDPLDIAVSFINDNLALLGLEEGDVDEIRVCDVVYSGVSGTHVYKPRAWTPSQALPLSAAQGRGSLQRPFTSTSAAMAPFSASTTALCPG